MGERRDVLSFVAIAVSVAALVLSGVGLGLNRVPGPIGLEGRQGEPGPTTVWAAVDEPAGANCPNGGKLLRWGPDANGNGVLEGTEAVGSTYLCSWRPAWPPPPCEANCSWHGLRTFTQSGGRLDTVNVTGT